MATEKDANDERDSKDNQQLENILHTLNLIKHIVHHFQVKDLKTIGECLLRLITFKDVVGQHLF